jgi:tetratricopeptide (TPR) repeat protein
MDEPIERASCQDCHMPKEGAPLGDAAAKSGQVRSHRFAGAHTWLAAMRHDPVQLAAEEAMLQGAASIDIAAAVADDGTRTLPAEGAPVVPGHSMTLDVVVRNERVGHRFPGGVLDAQDTWIEVRVTDARGRLIAEAGVAHEGREGDDTAHLLRAVQGDERGTPILGRETDLFRAPVTNHTIAPRDAGVIRYAFVVPASLNADARPLRVVARLRHRSRNLVLSRETCAQSRTSLGARFAQDGVGPGAVIDGCMSEPVTLVAEAHTWLGGSRPSDVPPPPLPLWRRLYDHALGLSHALQEDVDSARPSLQQAMGALPASATRERAMLWQLGAEIAVREGRTDEALDRLLEADRLVPAHSAVYRVRAEALGSVWRWREAMDPMQHAARAAPLDDTVWSRLATACGSAGDPDGALAASIHGLELAPRDADLLRVQALALEGLGAAEAEVARARAAFTAWRPPDDAPGVKNACAQRFPWCAVERLPVHVHSMRQGDPR